MSGLQSPLWITVTLAVAVAVLGLFGPWGNAWISSRRAHRSERRQFAHQKEMTQREEKKSAYADYLAALMKWGWLLDKAQGFVDLGRALPADLVASLERAMEVAVETYAGVLIVADPHGHTDIEYGFYDHLEVHSDCLIGKSDETTYYKMHEAQDWVRRRARDELAIEQLPTTDEVTRVQPSERTS